VSTTFIPTPARTAARGIGGLCAGAAAMTAAMAVASAASTIVAGDTLGRRWGGLPPTAGIVGTGVGALLLPHLIGRAGRRRGLLTGYGVALAGAVLTSLASVVHDAALTGFGLLAGMLLLGAGNAAGQLTRYLAGDLFPADQRGRAIALVVLGSTVGAVGGPLLLPVSHRLADAIGVDARAGTFLLGAVAVLIALLASLAAGAGPARPVVAAMPVRALLRQPAARGPLTAMAGAQVVMVAVMTAAPLDMHHHGSGLSAIGLVLSAHTLGMFAVAPLSGRLADRHGGGPVMLAGLCVAAGACAFAAGAAQAGDAPHGVIYFALGVAWNLAFVGGSTALSHGADPEQRLALEGAVDGVVWSIAAFAGAGSTVLLGLGGFRLLGGIAAVIALVAAVAVASVDSGRTELQPVSRVAPAKSPRSRDG